MDTTGLIDTDLKPASSPVEWDERRVHPSELQPPTEEAPLKDAGVRLLLAGLLCSGVAGIINQVVWQRALKIYLAGSEAISAMIVVLVFMLGLGLGSQWSGKRSSKSKNPLFGLALVEFGLAVVNAIVCLLLSLDLSDSIYGFQRIAVSLGIPLRVIYCATAGVVLTLPCFLMGMTVPFATEGCQRQLGVRENRFLGVLFLLNTRGAVAGALISGFLLLPLLGQRLGLLVAVGLNAAAGVLVLLIIRKRQVETTSVVKSEAAKSAADVTTSSPFRLRPELVAGFLLGFVSLAYEMYLFRIAALVHRPFPYTFSLVLALFLLTWSVGVKAAGRLRERIPFWMVATGISIAVVPQVYRFARSDLLASIPGFNAKWLVFLVCFAPCVMFGILFTQVVARFAKSWGADVGRYFAWNTFGSCAGILLGTLIGLELAPEVNAWILAGGMIALCLGTYRSFHSKGDNSRAGWSVQRICVMGTAGFALLMVIQLWEWNHNDRSLAPGKVVAAYHGKGGVLEIDREGNLGWDGLWHSQLSRDRNHVGTTNWNLAALPLLCRSTERAPKVCVIGLGSGITAGVLAESSKVDRVVVYEVNEKLKAVLRDYPAGTMHVAQNSKIDIVWQDGRSGLALNDETYDIISQQPLYLSQAGSSILLSREYFQLVKSRLNPGGVFCIYCNSYGNAEQARAVRTTARSVFRHGESFAGGYLLVVSDRPIRFDRESIERRLAGDATFRKDCEAYGLKRLLDSRDKTPLDWNGPVVITDDRPIVEYPWILSRIVPAKSE